MKPVYKRRIRELIKFIQSYPEHYFDMSAFVDTAYTPAQKKKTWGHSCGTTGCIAGFAAMKANRINPKGAKANVVRAAVGEDTDSWATDSGAFLIARRWMGLSRGTAKVLFTPGLHGHTYSDVRRRHAVAMLNKLLEHNGRIDESDWDEVMAR
jgi:hypothetical protein